MEYELLFFTSVANEERAPEIKREIEEILTKQGGKITADFSDIGKRKLAYPIKKQTHGFFSFCCFTLDEKENLPEINRRLSLSDKIMRHLIVRASEVGKPISTSGARQEEKSAAKQEKIAQKDEKEAPSETKAKVGLTELDEKLSEILEETPE